MARRALRARTVVFAMAALTISAVTFAALAIAVQPAHAEDRTAPPQIVIGAPVSTEQRRCVDVSIGGERSFGCINEKFKRQVDQINPVMNLPPIDAKSQDLKVGVVNMPAVQQQYGRNFGVSVIPYRPAPLVFGSPAGRR